jgi:hypothetical protein
MVIVCYMIFAWILSFILWYEREPVIDICTKDRFRPTDHLTLHQVHRKCNGSLRAVVVRQLAEKGY